VLVSTSSHGSGASDNASLSKQPYNVHVGGGRIFDEGCLLTHDSCFSLGEGVEKLGARVASGSKSNQALASAVLW
jgi:hypothetical protein